MEYYNLPGSLNGTIMKSSNSGTLSIRLSIDAKDDLIMSISPCIDTVVSTTIVKLLAVTNFIIRSVINKDLKYFELIFEESIMTVTFQYKCRA